MHPSYSKIVAYLSNCSLTLTLLSLLPLSHYIQGNGKLRVLYEGFPMAMIMEQAGGAASTGMFRGEIRRLLDLVPCSIHDKCPVLIGSTSDVDRVLSYYNTKSDEA